MIKEKKDVRLFFSSEIADWAGKVLNSHMLADST